MKELIKLFEKDIQSEHFTKRELIVYGILGPVALFALMCLAGFIETL